MELNNKDMGKRIRKQREYLSLTREDLAERLAVSVNFYKDIELGRAGMSLKTVAKISSALNITTDFIIFGKEETEDNPVYYVLKTLSVEEQDDIMELVKAYFKIKK